MIPATLTLDEEPRDTGLCDCARCCNAQVGRYWFVAVAVEGEEVATICLCDSCKQRVMD